MATGIRKSPFMFNAPTGMEQRRFVVLDKATSTVALAVDATIDGVTVGNEDGGVISVQSIKDVTEEFFITLGGTVSQGDDLIADANGLAIDGVGTGAVFAKGNGVAGDTIGAYSF